MENYVLLNDFDWFGKIIKKGAIYKQYKSTKDKFRCFTTNGCECPHFDLTFMTVRENPKWFFQLNELAINSAFVIGRDGDKDAEKSNQ